MRNTAKRHNPGFPSSGGKSDVFNTLLEDSRKLSNTNNSVAYAFKGMSLLEVKEKLQV